MTRGVRSGCVAATLSCGSVICVSLLCDRHRQSSFHPRWCLSRWSDCVSPSHQSINPVLSRGYKRRKSPSGRNLLFGQNSFSGKIPSRPEPLVGQNPLSGPRASRLPGQNSFSGKIPFRAKFLFGQNSFSPRAPRRAKPLVGAPTVEKIIPLSQRPTFGQEPLAVVVGAHAGSHKRAAKCLSDRLIARQALSDVINNRDGQTWGPDQI